MKHYLIIFLVLLIAVILASCGSKKSPTGGPQDTEKPIVLTSVPVQFGQIENGKIEINFSKPLDRSSVAQAIYIYPPVGNKKISVDRSTLLIRCFEELLPDTNYYITLSTRLKDVRGNALAANQTLVFAHGKLNNNRVSGALKYEDSADAGSPVQVSLLSADSLMVLQQNVQNSSYAVESLNPAAYILRAYVDKDRNGRYDFSREPYFSSNLDLRQSANLDISLAYADTSLAVIKSAVAKSNREVLLTFSEAVRSFGPITILSSDKQKVLPVLLTRLDGEKLTLLTEPQDAQAYSVEVARVKDLKGNITDKTSLEFRSSQVYDTTPPAVLSSEPRNGTSVATLYPVIKVRFSEIVPRSGIKVSLKASDSATEIPVDILQSDSDVYIFQPRDNLINYRSHVLSISATDISGNKMAADYQLIFLPLQRGK